MHGVPAPPQPLPIVAGVPSYVPGPSRRIPTVNPAVDLPPIGAIDGETLRRYMTLGGDKSLTNRKWTCPVDGCQGTHLHRMMEHVEKFHIQQSMESEDRKAVWKRLVEAEKEHHEKLYARQEERAAMNTMGRKRSRNSSFPPPPPDSGDRSPVDNLVDRANAAFTLFTAEESLSRNLKNSRTMLDMLDSFIKIGRLAQERDLNINAADVI